MELPGAVRMRKITGQRVLEARHIAHNFGAVVALDDASILPALMIGCDSYEQSTRPKLFEGQVP